MNSEFGFDRKAFRREGEALDKAAREDAIARKHVRQLDAEQPGGEACQQPVSQHMTRAIGGGVGVYAAGCEQVAAGFAHHLHHAGRRARVISVVAIHQNINVGLDVGKHAAHDIALALTRLGTDHGARRARHFYGVVPGIVVIDIDDGFRQRGAEIAHHLGDGRLFVVARHQNGDVRAHGILVTGHH